MQPTIQQFQQLADRVMTLESFVKDLEYSNSIPRNVETAFAERLKNIFKKGLIYGTGALSGGHFDVTDVRITTTSIGFAVRANTSSPFAGRSDLDSGYLSGHTWRFAEGTASETYQINYLIIP